MTAGATGPIRNRGHKRRSLERNQAGISGLHRRDPRSPGSTCGPADGRRAVRRGRSTQRCANRAIAHMTLCDHVQVADGKLFINGGGISRFHGPGLPPGTSVAVLVLIPWELTNAPIVIDLRLLTQDGQPVQDSEGAEIGIPVRTEVGRPLESNRESPSICPHFPRGRHPLARQPLHSGRSA